jgi:hypothetical protein
MFPLDTVIDLVQTDDILAEPRSTIGTGNNSVKILNETRKRMISFEVTQVKDVLP